MKPISTQDIASLQEDCIARWKADGITLSESGLNQLIEENHAFNYQLWHAEDRARREDKGFEYVYLAKREIDHCNQQRNNRMEAIDSYFWELLKPSVDSSCPVHSETPGMMIDRLSIMALKKYHMAEQTVRPEVDEAHREKAREKCNRLNAQHQQLLLCLNILLKEIQEARRTFRLYHQCKMYNDPTLNPALYQRGSVGDQPTC